MVPFGFTITPPGSPMPPSSQPSSAYPHFTFATIARTSTDSTSAFDMQRRTDTIAASPAVSHQDDSWSTPAPTSYDMDRAAAIAHKIVQEELALLTPAAMLHLGGQTGIPFEYEGSGFGLGLAVEHKPVRFTGLYVVNGPTESKHIRYSMEIAVPELQLRTRCIQRFQSFYQLRKRLLKATKRCCCHHVQPEHYYNHNRNSGKVGLLHSSWDELPFTASSRGCRSCRRVRKSLKTQAFPHRKLFTTSVADVETRSFQLETFLGVCTRMLVDWAGCERGKKLFAGVMGKFLGVNILQQLFPSRYGRGSGYSNSLVAANHMEVGSDGGFGGSEYAQSVATTGLSTRSESSYTTSTATGNGGASGAGFHVGVAPSCRTLLSTFSSSSSSLSLHDEDDYQS